MGSTPSGDRSPRALLARAAQHVERLTSGRVTIRVSRRRLLVGGGTLLAAGGAVAVGQRFQLLSRAEQFLQQRQTHVQVTGNPLTLVADFAAGRRTISPEIYGLGNFDRGSERDLGARLARWGGEQNTRYNWKLGNAWNLNRDWDFSNTDFGFSAPGYKLPSGTADRWIADNLAAGMSSIVTIPTIGWVAKDSDRNSRSLGVPNRGGPPLAPGGDAIAGYDPTANRRRTSVPSRARKAGAFQDPPNLADPTVAQDEWVYHLTRRFGSAAQGGVRYYALDNEPDLWSFVQTDVHPADLSYDQMRDMFFAYADAIKDVDPTAQVVAPNIWDWFSTRYSPLDRGTNEFAAPTDFHAHGDVPFLEWWLEQIRAHDQQVGHRSLDVLALHIYPQGGVYSPTTPDTSPAMSALRLRSTRILWDPTYTEESWIKQQMAVIPRMRDWVARHSPGAKIGIGEYSWGATESVNGALAQAMALGIFAREGLDLAAHWGGFKPGTPGYIAFKLYGNYDSRGSAFSGTAFSASSSRDDLLTCYGAEADAGRTALLMVVNASPDSNLTPTIQLRNWTGATLRRARVWRFWPDDEMALAQAPDVALAAGPGASQALTYTFPASSITLLRLEASA